MATEIKLPDLGEGIEGGDILEILVKEGDVIEKGQGIVEIETDKATVEVPSDLAGKVAAIHVSEGQSVPIGTAIITLEIAEPSATTPPAAQAPPPKEATPPAATSEPEPAAAPPAVPPTAPPIIPPATDTPAASTPPPIPSAPPPPTAIADAAPPPTETTSAETTSAETTPTETPSTARRLAPAGPAVRRFAREVGVDLSAVPGTGPGGRITRDDVLAVVRKASQSGGASESAGAAPKAAPATASSAPVEEEQETDTWGPVRTEKMPKIRKTIAAKMHESWSTVPRVTNFDDADVTSLEQMRQASKADYAKSGLKLTAMPFIIKSVAMALKSNPLLNAALDMDNGQIIYKEYINIGIAVDTDRGLVVPALRQADQLSIPKIARALGDIAENARIGKFAIEDLRGSTFSISNLGAIGGTYSTPIINTPEVAILLVGRARKMPVVVDDEIAPRLMMPLSLSYDHRLVDGAAAARFLNEVIGYLSTPSRLLMAF